MTTFTTTTTSSENRSLARLPMELFAFYDDDNDESMITNANRQEIASKLSASRIQDIKSFLRINNPHHLVRILDPILTYRECVELYRRICWHCSPKPVTALSSLRMMMMMQTTNRNGSNIHDRNNMEYGCFPTGLSLLDTYLRGGCRVGSLTEIVGCAGIGKSQVAMQMALLAVTQKQAGTILIDTEAKISVSRLQEMALARNQIPSTVLSHISVHSPESVDVLRAVLNTLEDDILARSDDVQRFPVRLLIVDSIAAPIRRSEIAYSAAQQASILLGIAQTLKRLADQFRIVVLIINQVGGVLSLQHHPNIQNTHPRATGFESSEINHHQFINTTKAALGTAWHHCVSTRIRLDQKDHHRYATVVKSNVVAPSPPFAYQITHQGIVDVECATKNPL